MAHEGNKGWLSKWIRFQPHQIIGSVENPYLRRWFVIPKNRVCNLYLHQFLRSDDDRALHDHPWWFVSLILKGGYWEHREGELISSKSFRKAGGIAFRRAKTAHRVELDLEYPIGWPNDRAPEKPAWTLVFTGPKTRRWGFLCPEGWKWWRDFDHDNGCGEN